MKPVKEISRVLPGLKIIVPGMVWGIFIGSAAALLVPSVVAIGSLIAHTLAGLPQTRLGQSVTHTLAKPENWISIVVVLLLTISLIARRSLSRFVVRLYTWSVYEATILWIAASLAFFTLHSPSLRLCALLVAAVLTLWIGSARVPIVSNIEPLFSPDRPIERSSEDKLDRRSLVVSLVNRLLSDAAPVIALIGAFGDGKTSILNLLREELQSQRVVVVSFKSSLPGDNLTLVSTLFNSIGQQIRHRFFVRGLGVVLRKFVRRFVGVLPSAPSGLKEIFSEPSQEDELTQLTTRLETLPVRRVVVLLDDMDRMQGSELRALLKVIRAADEYPKLSFVCAFNKKALVDALIRHPSPHGRHCHSPIRAAARGFETHFVPETDRQPESLYRTLATHERG